MARPLESIKERIQRLLCVRADWLSAATGNTRFPASRFQPCRPMAPSAIGDACGGMPFTAPVSSRAARATKGSSDAVPFEVHDFVLRPAEPAHSESSLRFRFAKLVFHDVRQYAEYHTISMSMAEGSRIHMQNSDPMFQWASRT
jgi:hypothetical protein